MRLVLRLDGSRHGLRFTPHARSRTTPTTIHARTCRTWLRVHHYTHLRTRTHSFYILRTHTSPALQVPLHLPTRSFPVIATSLSTYHFYVTPLYTTLVTGLHTCWLHFADLPTVLPRLRGGCPPRSHAVTALPTLCRFTSFHAAFVYPDCLPTLHGYILPHRTTFLLLHCLRTHFAPRTPRTLHMPFSRLCRTDTYYLRAYATFTPTPHTTLLRGCSTTPRFTHGSFDFHLIDARGVTFVRLPTTAAYTRLPAPFLRCRGHSFVVDLPTLFHVYLVGCLRSDSAPHHDSRLPLRGFSLFRSLPVIYVYCAFGCVTCGFYLPFSVPLLHGRSLRLTFGYHTRRCC